MNENKPIFSEEVRILDGACQDDNLSIFAGIMLTEAEKEMRDDDGDKGADVLVAAHAIIQAITYSAHLLTKTIQDATTAIVEELRKREPGHEE